MSKFIAIVLSLVAAFSAAAAPIDSLAARVTENTSAGRIIFKEVPGAEDFFEIKADDGRVLIEGNNAVSMAVGLNWYLKYVAGIHISWNNLTQPLPEVLPLPDKPIRHRASVADRYYLNYCTHSYSMAFWDEDRWMKEIDWMALHGVNMPLAMTGIETVWRNMLRKLGYTDGEIGEFISGPGFFAWWQMNNLEGWGGPLPDQWYTDRAELQKKILSRMRSLGIKPVLPGYVGMVPRNIGKKLGYAIDDPGLWCGFPRPAFLSTNDEHYDSIADLYYKELTALYGEAPYYSMDPFHEGGAPRGVNLSEAGIKIANAMKRANPDARWVIQSWGGNPQLALIDTLAAGDLVVLDLYSDKVPKWRKNNGYGKHDWLYCMLLNFGGNIGLHGRADFLVDGFYDAMESAPHLTGIGATPEGIDNNPVMYELLFELPWRAERFDTRAWLADYLRARYGAASVDEDILKGWDALWATVYNAPVEYPGQGTVESLFCARPSWNPKKTSTWGYAELFYSPDSTAKAAACFAPRHGNNNFEYDRIDIIRQANADRANLLLSQMGAAHEHGNRDSVEVLAGEFMNLLLEQDSLLSLRRDTGVAAWLDAAGALANGDKDAEKLYRRNAALQITVWGDSVAANRGGLHDYSHREWGGILRELYYNRWKAFFDHELNGAPAPDYYRMEVDWVDRRAVNR